MFKYVYVYGACFIANRAYLWHFINVKNYQDFRKK